MADATQKNVHEYHGPGATMPLDTATGGAAARSWDPYDVWLRRVKQPRDLRPVRTAALSAHVATPAANETGAPTRLLPHPR